MAKTKQKLYVVVRTYSAGVHVGELAAKDGKQVRLTNARRIWSWQGRNTLHEIANHGVGEGSRVSEVVTAIELTEAIEVIACSAEGAANLRSALWNK
jgi:hypothetical protein